MKDLRDLKDLTMLRVIHAIPEKGLFGKDPHWTLRAPTPHVHPFHPGFNQGANIESISQRCHPVLVAFVWELTKDTINLPLGCLQGGEMAPTSPFEVRAHAGLTFDGFRQLLARVVHLGRSTCHAISGRGVKSTRIPEHVGLREKVASFDRGV